MTATAATATATATTTELSSQRDLYNILDPSFARGDHILHQPGTILARLTMGGWINALSGRVSGLVNVQTAKPLDSTMTQDTLLELAHGGGMTLGDIRRKAMGLSQITSARLEVDMMQSTPQRIVEMLCPEVTMGEIAGIQKRIYDTVILKKGTNASANAAALESVEGLPVAARVGMHDIDKYKRCKVCGNNDQGAFVLDKKNGDLICTECGTVATESLMHEGTQFRKFEGEEDRNHHGDVANPLYSNAYNMGTSLSGVSMAVGAGIGGYGSGGKKGMETILKNIHNYTEMNISQFGKEEKKTRVGYKDRQKKVGGHHDDVYACRHSLFVGTMIF
jgi:Transcription initiation factor TFIIIB, Brf1 subunit/Transcription initiation factor TFIIB